MKLFALFVAVTIVSLFVALASIGAGDHANPEPWWVAPGFFGGVALALVFAVAAVIRVITLVVDWLQRHR